MVYVHEITIESMYGAAGFARNMATRTERDTFGPLEVPADKYVYSFFYIRRSIGKTRNIKIVFYSRTYE